MRTAFPINRKQKIITHYFNQIKNNIPSPELIFICLLLFSISVSAQTTWQSNLVQLNTNTGKLNYTPDPTSGIQIPDFSRAGYKGGGVPIPTVPVKQTISPISGDNTQHIQNAIDAVSALPINSDGFRGAVLLNPGVYNVSGTIKITTSGVILRGSGRGDNSSANTHIFGLGNNPSDRSIIEIGGGSNTLFAGKVSGTQTNITSPLVKVGSKELEVADATPFKVGDNIIIYHPCTAEWLTAIDGGGTDSDPSWEVNSQPIIYNTKIEKIKCNTIFTNSPVFNTLDLNLAQSYIYVYDRDGLVENVGIENLRVDIEHDSSDPDDRDHARNAVLITQAENAWVKGCEFLHFWYAGVDMQTANYITVEDCRALLPVGPTTGGFKYNFCVSKATQNTLFTNCEASEGRHAYVSNGTSSVAGIVFHKCTSINPFTSSEGHRRWTTGLLYDNFIDKGNNPGRVLALYNRGRWGTGHGWSAANSVAWNCDVSRSSGNDGDIVIQRPPTAQNFAIGCKGVVTGSGPYTHPAGYIEGTNNTAELIPNSLYDAQLNSRNYTDSINNFLLTDQQNACKAYTWIDGITYFNSTNSPKFTLTDVNGCDSIIRLDLTINTLDTTVTENGTTLTANAPGATYQWLDCNNGFSPILGEVNQNFTTSKNGVYSVEITQGNCTDTSACFPIIVLNSKKTIAKQSLTAYPNPTKEFVQLDLGETYSSVTVTVINAIGKIVSRKTFKNSKTITVSINGTPGYYFIETSSINGKKLIKILKE